MNLVIENIKERRSNIKMSKQEVSDDVINQIIEAGCWAPTHRRTEPWRFVVFKGEGRNALQDAMTMGTAKKFKHLKEMELAVKLDKIKGKAFRAPVVIAVWCAAGRGEINPPVWEDHAAVVACLQNMSLAAHALGLSSLWGSGPVDFPEIQALMSCETDSFNAEMGDKVLGLLNIGYTAEGVKIPKRQQPEFATKTKVFT